MIDDIRLLVAQKPFVPFTIHMTSGRQIRVPHLDHIFIFPSSTRVIVHHDANDYDILSPDHMDHITVDAENRSNPTAN